MSSTNESKRPQKKSALVTAKQLMATQFEKPRWVVDGLLRLGRKRISLLAGKPEDGKSALSRQLAVAVCQGKQFLGRDTMRSPVILWQSEEDQADLQESLAALGYDPSKDENLYIFIGSTDENNVEMLRDELRLHPDVRLCIIETLDDLLKISDLKENSASREAFDKFDKAVVDEFHPTVSFLALHHLKKNEVESSSGEMLLGATVIRGRTDAKIYMRRESDDDERRMLFASVRRGVPIPKTYLKWHAATETSTLDITVAEDRKNNAGHTEDRTLGAMKAYLASHPNSTEHDCLIVPGNNDAKKRLFRKAIVSGIFVRSGKGTKNNPYLYNLKPIETEEAIVDETLAEQMGVAA